MLTYTNISPALVDGLSETVADYTHEVAGTTPKDVMDLLLLTQYFGEICRAFVFCRGRSSDYVVFVLEWCLSLLIAYNLVYYYAQIWWRKLDTSPMEAQCFYLTVPTLCTNWDNCCHRMASKSKYEDHLLDWWTDAGVVNDPHFVLL